MKLFTTALAALASMALAAPDAAIYTYDTNPSAAPQSIPTISPQNARLVLFNHMGYAPYTSLNGVDDDTLAILAASPGQQPLFSTAAESKKKVVLLIHGVKDVQDVLSDEEGRRRQIASLDEIPPKSADVLFTQELLNGKMALGLDFEICSADMLKPFSFVQGGWKNTEVEHPNIVMSNPLTSCRCLILVSFLMKSSHPRTKQKARSRFWLIISSNAANRIWTHIGLYFPKTTNTIRVRRLPLRR